MRRHVVVRAEQVANRRDEFLLHRLRLFERAAGEGVLIVQLATDDFVDPDLVDRQLAQHVGEVVGIAGRPEIGRGALQHRDVAALGCDRRDQCRRGGTGADHHDVLAAVVQILRPGLWVDDAALEDESIPSQCGV